MLEKGVHFLSLALLSSVSSGQRAQVAPISTSNTSVCLSNFSYSSVSPYTHIYNYINFVDIGSHQTPLDTCVSRCFFDSHKPSIPEIDFGSAGFTGLKQLYPTLSSRQDDSQINSTSQLNTSKCIESLEDYIQKLGLKYEESLSAESIDWVLHLDNSKADLHSLSHSLNGFPHNICEPLSKIENSTTLSRKKNLFQNLGSKEYQDKLLLHVLGDSFGKGSSLEGANLLRMGKFLQKILKSGLIDAELKNDTRSINTKEALIKSLNKYMLLDRRRVNAPSDFVQHLKKEVFSLKEGEHILISGGWAKEESAHSVLYKVSKDEQGKINLKIYNTGEGVNEYHQVVQFGDSEFILAEKELVDINPHKLTQHAFLATLLGLLSQPNQYWSAKFLYEGVLPELGGFVEDKQHSPDKILRPQVSGTCAYRAWTAYLHSLFEDKRLYYRANFKIKLKVLVDYLDVVPQEEFVSCEQRRKLVEKSVTFLARELIHLSHQGIISQEEYRQTSGFLARIKFDLQIAEAKAAKEHRISLGEKNFTLNATLSKELNPYFVFDEFQERGVGSIEAPQYLEKSVLDSQYTQDNFLHEFKVFTDHIQKLILNQEFHLAQTAIRDLTSRWSFSEGANDHPLQIPSLVSKLSETEIMETLSELAELSYANYAEIANEYIQHFENIGSYPPDINPRVALSQMKLILFGDLLLERLLDLKGLKPKSLMSSKYKSLFLGNHVYFLLFNPSEDLEYKELTQLYKQRKKHDSLFEYKGEGKLPLNLELIPDVELFNWDYLRSTEFVERYHTLVSSKPHVFSKQTGNLQRDIEKLGLKEILEILFLRTATASAYTSFLPDWFYSIRDISFLSSLFLNSVKIPHPPDYKFPPQKAIIGFDLILEGVRRGEKSINSIVLKLFQDWYTDSSSAQPPLFFLHRKQMPLTAGIELNSVGELLSYREEESLHCGASDTIEEIKKVQTSTNEDVFDSLEVGFQSFREFASLFLYPELQLINTLGYFSNHPFALKNRAMQGAFEFLLYGSPHLIEACTSHSSESIQLIQKYSDFFTRGVESSLREFEPELLIFFAENTLRFNHYVQFAKENNPRLKVHPAILIRLQNSIKKALEEMEFSDTQKKSLLMLYGLSFLNKDEIPASIWAEVLTSYFKTKKISQMIDRQELQTSGTKETEFDFYQLLDKKLPEFERNLSAQEKEMILNQLIQENHDPDADNLAWKQHSPYVYRSTDGKLEIDLRKGSIRDSGEEFSNFELSRFARIFTDMGIDINSAEISFSSGCYTIQVPNYPLIRVLENPIGSKKEALQLFYEGTWYQYSPHPLPSSKAALQHLYTQVLREGRRLVGPLPSSMHHFEQSYLKEIPRYMLQDPNSTYKFFYSKEGNEMVVLNKASNKVEYKMTIHEETNEGTFIKLDPSTSTPTHELVHRKDPNLADWIYLYHFEAEPEVLFWRGIDRKTLDRVEFPAYPLSFNKEEVRGAQRLMCEQEKGFFISPDQYVKGMGNFAGFLVLENEEGEKKALISKLPLVPRNTKESLKTEYYYPNQELKNSYSLFPLSESREVKFSRLNRAQKFQLATIYLSEQRYQRAEEILLSSGSSSIAPFNEDEIKQLLYLVNLENTSDPRGYYIKAKAAHILAKNHLDFFIEPDSDLLRSVSEVTRAYLPHMDLKLHPRLSIQERSDLLTFISHSESYHTGDLAGLASLHEVKECLHGQTLRDQIQLSNRTSKIVEKFNEYTESNEREMQFPCSLMSGHNQQIGFFIFEHGVMGNTHVSVRRIQELFSLLLDETDSVSNKVKTVKQILNLKLPQDISRESLHEEIKTAFSLMVRSIEIDPSASISDKQWLIYVFNAIAHSPELFEDYETLQQVCSRSAKGKPKELVVDKLLEATIEYYRNLIPIEKSTGSPHWVHRCDKSNYTRAFETLTESPLELPAPKVNASLLKLDLPIASSLVSLKLPQPKGSLEKLEIKALEESLKHYQTSNPVGMFKSFSLERADSLKGDLEDQIRATTQVCQTIHEGLLKLANKLPGSPSKRSEREMHVVAGSYPSIGIKDLTLLFLEKDYRAFTKLNSALSIEDASHLQSLVQEYLIHSTDLIFLNNSLEALRDYIEFVQNGGNLYPEPQVLKNLKATFNLSRQYSIEEHPQMLVFEEAMGIILRRDQVESIEKLTQEKGPNRALELVVGAGKTFVLSPLIAKYNADGHKLSVMMVPEELFPSTSLELESLLGNSFRTTIQAFHFDRSKPLNLDRLKWVHKQLKDIITNKKVLMLTPHSLQSFYLMALEKLFQYEEAPLPKEASTLWAELNEYKGILKLFREKGNLLIDEIDLVLHPLHEHRFSYKTQLPPHEILKYISNIFEVIVDEFPDLLDLYSNPVTQAFSIEHYNQECKSKLIQGIIQSQSAQKDEKFSAFLQSPNNVQFAQQFLENTIKEVHIQRGGDYLALAKEMLHTLLPLTLSKSVDEHYGRSREDMKLEIAIPYHGSNHPAEGSRFGTFYETACYTYQYYLKKGISKEQIRALFESLHEDFARQLREPGKALNRDFSNLNVLKALSEISPKLADIKYLSHIGANLNEAQSLINENPRAILNFVRSHILPKLKVSHQHLRVGPELYNWLFKRANGFSGTLWDSETFPEEVETHFSPEATGKILTSLMQHSSESFQVISPTRSLSEMTVNLINRKNQDRVQAIIDSGAYYKGFTGLEVAESILNRKVLSERIVPIRGVVFYDEKDQIKVLVELNGSREVRDYQEGEFKPEELITFYDQKHTTGSNIPQSVRAVGLVTVGPHMKLRDLIQSTGRMRKIDEDQRVKFVLLEDVFSLILEKNIEAKLDLNSLVSFVFQNQLEEKIRNNYRSFKSKLDSVIEFSIIEELLFGDLSQERTRAILKEFKNTFLLGDKVDPLKQFRYSAEERETSYLISRALRSFMKKAKRLEDYGIEIKGFETEEKRQKLLEKYLRILPKTLLERRGDYELGVQEEHETNMEDELALKMEVKYGCAEDFCGRLPQRFFNFDPSSSAVIGQDLFPVLDIDEIDFLPEEPVLPLVSVNSAIQTFMGEEYDFFDDCLMASKGILPFTIFAPFAFEMRIPRHVLILEDKETKDFKFVMVDEASAATLKTALLSDLVPNGANYKLALYHPQIDAFSRSSEDPSKILSQEKIRAHPKFNALNLQMKFFRGDLYYSQTELKELHRLVLNKAKLFADKNKVSIEDAFIEVKANVQKLFEKIIEHKDRSSRIYRDSPIFLYFKQSGSKDTLT